QSEYDRKPRKHFPRPRRCRKMPESYAYHQLLSTHGKAKASGQMPCLARKRLSAKVMDLRCARAVGVTSYPPGDAVRHTRGTLPGALCANLFQLHHVDLTFAALEGGGVGECRLGDVGQRLPGEEALVTGDEPVRKGEQSGEDVVLDDRVREILEEEIGFFLVNIQSERSQLAALERVDQRARIHQGAAAGVDEHRSRLHSRQGCGVDEVVSIRREWQVQRDDVGGGKEILQRHVLAAQAQDLV